MENEINNKKNENFKRLAGARVNKAIKSIELIGNLASSNYDYTSEQVEKIIVALNAAVAEVDEKFQKRIDKERKKFNF